MMPYLWSMVRQHLTTYTSVLVTVIFGSALAGSTVGVFLNVLAAPGLPPVSARSAELTYTLEGAESMWGTGMVIAVFVMVFLVSSTMAFALNARRRELALLGLMGATAAQLKRLTRAEAIIIGFAGSGIGAMLAIPGTMLLQRISVGLESELMPSQLGQPSIRTFAIIIVVTIVMGMTATLAGAWAPTRRIAKVPPLEAIVAADTRNRTMTISRWIVGIAGIAGAIAILSLSPGGADEAIMTILGMSYLLIIALTALGPIVVPPVASLLGSIALILWPGAGFLAKAHCRWNTGRTSALAAPPLLLIGMIGGLLIVGETMSGGEMLQEPESRQVLLILFGGAALFTVFNCVLTVLSSARERRGEFDLLRTTGAGRRQIIGILLVETCVVLATSALLMIVVLGFVSVRVTQILQQAGLPQTLHIPGEALIPILGICMVASFLAALGGGIWTTRAAAAA